MFFYAFKAYVLKAMIWGWKEEACLPSFLPSFLPQCLASPILLHAFLSHLSLTPTILHVMGNHFSSPLLSPSFPNNSSAIPRDDGLKSLPLSPPLHNLSCLTAHLVQWQHKGHQEEEEEEEEEREKGHQEQQQQQQQQEGEYMVVDLPQELLDRIRACLSVSAYFQSFLVCKQWKDTAFSSHMVSLCNELHPPEPWLFALPIKHCRNFSYAFDPALGKWRRMPLSFLASDCVYPLAAAGGLLCLSTYVDEDQVLSVVSPLTGTCKVLPKWKEDRIDPVVGLVVEGTGRNYKVIAVGSYETEAVTEVYDSTTNHWTITGNLPYYQKMTFACSVFSKGLLYCLTAGPPAGLLVYDVETGIWKEIPVLIPSSYAYGMLVEHRGRLLLIGLSQGGEPFRSIRIWEFLEPCTEMHELERMPFGMFKDFWGRGKGPLSFQFVSSGDLIYFYSKKTPRLVVCDLTRKPVQWQWLPASPADVDWGEIQVMNFCIHPVLNSSLQALQQYH